MNISIIICIISILILICLIPPIATMVNTIRLGNKITKPLYIKNYKTINIYLLIILVLSFIANVLDNIDEGVEDSLFLILGLVSIEMLLKFLPVFLILYFFYRQKLKEFQEIEDKNKQI